MARTATAEPNAKLKLAHGGVSHSFDFGDDGTRQVTEAEVAALESYQANGGPLKVEITETKTAKGGK